MIDSREQIPTVKELPHERSIRSSNILSMHPFPPDVETHLFPNFASGGNPSILVFHSKIFSELGTEGGKINRGVIFWRCRCLPLPRWHQVTNFFSFSDAYHVMVCDLEHAITRVSPTRTLLRYLPSLLWGRVKR